MSDTSGPTQTSEAMMNGSDDQGVEAPPSTDPTPKGKGRKRRAKSRLTLVRKKKKVATPSNANPTNFYEPRMFIRRIVYKTNENGGIILGSVQFYKARVDKFCVLYEDGEETYEEFHELRNKLATGEVIAQALPPQSNGSKKNAREEKKRPASGEASSSAPPKKKGRASGKKAAKK